VRIALLAASVAAIALAAVGLRQADGQRDAERVLRPLRPLSAAQQASVRRDLDRAAWLSPDVQPDVYRAVALALSRRPRAAASAIRAAAAREPRNLAVWAWARVVARRAGDRALLREARARIAALRPRVGA
jgi:hypothetical protein